MANRRDTGAEISRYTYTYDDVGNPTHVDEGGGNTVDWKYDDTDRLINEKRSGTGSFNTTYTYDAVGNRLVERQGAARTTSTYDAANQLETSVDGTGTTTYTYDDAGNLSVASAPGGSRTTYSWDDENRNTRIALPDSSLVTMSYRFDGLRYEKQTSTATERFIYDGQNYLVITDGAGAAQNVSNNEPMAYGNLISQQFLFGGAVWLPIYFHFDALGSTRQIVSESDALVNQYAYTAWGEAPAVLTSETVFSAFRWVGQLGYYFDQESDSYYVRARRYGPGIGRWLSQDPFFYPKSVSNVNSPDWKNDSLYEMDRPLLLTDPSGLLAAPPVVLVHPW